MKKILLLITASLSLIAVVGVLSSEASANKPTCGGYYQPPCEQPPPPPPPPAPQPPAPPTCVPTGAGQDGQPGNDNCAQVSPPPAPPAALPPPPAVQLVCDEGYTEVGRTATQVKCARTEIVTKTRTVKVPGKTPKPKIKRVVKWKKKVVFVNCPVPGKG